MTVGDYNPPCPEMGPNSYLEMDQSAASWRIRLGALTVRRRARDITKTRARWANIPIGDKDRLRAIVFERDGWCCVYCGTDASLTIDHVVPQSKGGHSRPDNLQTLCVSCNSAKCDRDDLAVRP